MKIIKFIFLSLTILIASHQAEAQVKQAYAIYNAKGKKVSYEKIIDKIEESDILLFGELHNSAIAHWLQLEVAKEMIKERKITFGAEMFETDNQKALSLYLKDSINAKGLDTMARLWRNFSTDYKPLVEIAKENNLPFIATNIPRKYASMVFKGGFEKLDTLPANEKKWIAPLPIAYDASLSQYVEMKKMMGDHGGDNLPKAQAIKDATMAYFISKNYTKGNLFIHFNGSFHSDFFQGILWYLQQSMPDLKYCTISTVTQADIDKLEKEHLGKADFIICIDEDVTNTY